MWKSVSSQFGRKEYGNVITIPNFPQPLITANCVSQTRFLIFSMTALHTTLTICSQKERKRVKHTRSCTLSHPHKECDLSWQFNLGLAGSPCLETSCFLKLRGCWGPLSTIKTPGINHKWSLHSALPSLHSAIPVSRRRVSFCLLSSPLQRTTDGNTNKQIRVCDYFTFCRHATCSAPWEFVKTGIFIHKNHGEPISSEDFQCICVCVCHRDKDKLGAKTHHYVHVSKSSLTHICNQ